MINNFVVELWQKACEILQKGGVEEEGEKKKSKEKKWTDERKNSGNKGLIIRDSAHIS